MVVILYAMGSDTVRVRYSPKSLYDNSPSCFFIDIDGGTLHLGIEQARDLATQILDQLHLHRQENSFDGDAGYPV